MMHVADWNMPKPAQEMKQTCQQLEKQREPQENGTGSLQGKAQKTWWKYVGLSWFINLMNTIVKIS